MPQPQANTASFIKGAPLRQPEYFIGPVAWWSGSLTCGGVERQILATAKAFKEMGRPIVLLCRTLSPTGGNDFFLAEAKASCKAVLEFSQNEIKPEDFLAARDIVEAAFENPPPVFRDSVAAYAAWFLRLRPRLLHVWNADHLEPLLAAVIAGIPKIVIAGQSLSPAQRAPYGFESVDDALAFALLGNIMRMPGVFMTNNSRAGCAAYEGWLGLAPGTVMLTPNIFDMGQWPRPDARRIQALREALGLPAHARLLGGLFRFVSIKDPELWVCTAMRACAQHADLYAVVCGDGPALASIREAVSQTSYADRILFPGSIKDVPAFLSLCSVFMHTAHVEGLPNVLLEALAYEVPVVTTRCGGAADVVTHGLSGFVVTERDDMALAKHVDYLLTHPDFSRKAGAAGRAHVERDFSAERTGEMQWQVYEKLLQPGVSSSSGQPKARRKRDRPLVSFFVAGHNVESYVADAMRSMLAQTMDDFELLIMDDGSTDKTYEVMKSMADPRVQVFRNEKNLGITRSLNLLLERCRGKYWAHMDGDDVCDARRLEFQVAAMDARRDASICGGQYVMFYPSGQKEYVEHPLDSRQIKSQLLFTNPFAHPFVMFKGEAFTAGNIKYSERMAFSVDYDIYLKAFLRLPETVFFNIPQVLGLYRRHEKQITSARRKEQLHYAFRAQMQVFQAMGISPGNALMRFHQNLFTGIVPMTADDMAGLVDWAFTLRMANAAKPLFDVSLFNEHLYARLKGIMQCSPSLSERHWWRLEKW